MAALELRHVDDDSAAHDGWRGLGLLEMTYRVERMLAHDDWNSHRRGFGLLDFCEFALEYGILFLGDEQRYTVVWFMS